MSTTTEDESATFTVTGAIHLTRRGRGGRKEVVAGPAPKVAAGRTPRIARLMALAIRFERLVRERVVDDYAELARLGHVSRARISQIMNLLHLAPDIQEALLNLPRTVEGRDPIVLRGLLPISAILEWRQQRRRWNELTNGQGR